MIKVHRVSTFFRDTCEIYYERDLTTHTKWGILSMLGFTEYILYTFSKEKTFNYTKISLDKPPRV